MKFIKEIVSTYLRIFTPIEYPKLGRWNVQHNTLTIHMNIDQANIDHSCCIVHNFQKEKEDKFLSYYL